jgi:hypothetical protein
MEMDNTNKQHNGKKIIINHIRKYLKKKNHINELKPFSDGSNYSQVKQR